MKKIYGALLTCTFCYPLVCQAQLQIRGTIADEDGPSIPYASVLLLNSSDSILVKGQVSNTDGFFTIDVKETGSYFITVSAIGYQEVSTPIIDLNKTNSPFDVGKILTREHIEQLNEVVVRAEKPLFEQKIDRTIINVKSSISRAGGSALDVLQRSPGVTVDKMSNSVAMSGKQGVRIMINGKISRIPPEAVVQMLEGISAENIEQIELITTPPSKYEAEGDAGMINIVLKQSEDLGTNGSLSAFTGYGRRGKYGGTFSINHRTKKLNLFGDFAARNDFSRQFWNSRWTTTFNSEPYEASTHNNRKPVTKVNNGSFGFDWNIGKNTRIAGLFNFFDRRWDMDALAKVSQHLNHDLSGTVSMNTIEENNWLQLLGNINFTHDFNQRYSLSFDFDQIDYDSQNPTDYYQDFFDEKTSPTGSAQLRSRKDTNIKINTTKVDFNAKVTDRLLVEVGAKGTFTKLQNDIVVDNLENDNWVSDNALTSYATMYENIGAGYASANFKATDKLDVQAGLRYEHTRTNIDTRAEQNVVDRNFGNWFPSVFLNNKINNDNSWVISYSRRIARPSFFQLAPFVIFNDPNSFFSGNISLLPSFTDAFKVEYRCKSALLSVQYSHDKNSIALFQPRVSDDNKQVSMAENLKYRNNYSVVLTFPVQITNWWEIQFNAIGNTFKIQADYLDNPMSLSVLNFSFNGTQKFKVSKSITAEVSGFYQSRQLWGVWEMAALGAVDFGMEKRFSNSSLRVSYSDIFGQNKWKFTADIPQQNLNSMNYIDFETTVVNITYTKNFGNRKLKSKSVKTGSKEEQERFSE